MAGKSGFMKDAFTLFAITLISGVALGAVYEVTKGPIEQATIAANNATYKEVFAEAETFDELADADLEGMNAQLTGGEFGNVALESVLAAKDAAGTELGIVVNSYSMDSYGGKVAVSVGIKEDGSITAVGIRETSDTPGLGLKAKDEKFKGQYTGKNAEKLSVTKSGSAGDTEINAISGATITSNAVTNAVNAALFFNQNYAK
ncbi:MAG: FMN-binding protein [Otoolea sp.]|nr:FMN-binding protein [Clostridium sp.]MDY5484588.1 FMN-binding protein [Clostridium sp.]